MLTIETQSCDGLTTAVCPELGITGFGSSAKSAQTEVFDAIISNATVVLKRQQQGDTPVSAEDKTLLQFAVEILKHRGSIETLFTYR